MRVYLWQTALLEDDRWQVRPEGRSFRPPTDVYETEESIIIRVEIAGMREDGFSLTYRDGLLTITGVRSDYDSKLGFHAMEIPFGRFNVEVRINPGGAVIPDDIAATYGNGFLVVDIPKAAGRRFTADSSREAQNGSSAR